MNASYFFCNIKHSLCNVYIQLYRCFVWKKRSFDEQLLCNKIRVSESMHGTINHAGAKEYATWFLSLFAWLKKYGDNFITLITNTDSQEVFPKMVSLNPWKITEWLQAIDVMLFVPQQNILYMNTTQGLLLKIIIPLALYVAVRLLPPVKLYMCMLMDICDILISYH